MNEWCGGVGAVVLVVLWQLVLASRPRHVEKEEGEGSERRLSLSRWGQAVHIERRVQHFSSTALLSYLAFVALEKHQVLVALLLGGVCSLMLAGQELRKRVPAVNQMYVRTFASMLRPHEYVQMPAAFFIVLASFFSALLVCSNIATPAMANVSLLIESLADPLAAMVGITSQSWSKHRYLRDGYWTGAWMKGKTRLGSLTMFLISALIFYVLSPHRRIITKMFVSIVGGVFVALSEGFANAPSVKLLTGDDNLAVPLTALSFLIVTENLFEC